MYNNIQSASSFPVISWSFCIATFSLSTLLVRIHIVVVGAVGRGRHQHINCHNRQTVYVNTTVGTKLSPSVAFSISYTVGVWGDVVSSVRWASTPVTSVIHRVAVAAFSYVVHIHGSPRAGSGIVALDLATV